MNKIMKKEIEFAGRKLVLENGELAPRAGMAIKASYGDTVLLATVCSNEALPEADFLGLRVEYEEKLYASGSIKSSRFMKRDGRSTDDAIISRRVIDHAIRPLFPKDFLDEVQLAITVLSLDEDADPELLGMIASSVALNASNIPFGGIFTAARVGLINDKFVLCPSKEDLHEKSDLDIIVSFYGKDQRFLACEAEANNIREDKILSSIEYARDSVQDLYKFIEDFVKELNPNNDKYEYESRALSEELLKAVKDVAQEKIDSLYGKDVLKSDRDTIKGEILKDLSEKLEGDFKKAEMQSAVEYLEKEAIKKLVLEKDIRLDGRKMDEVRKITSKISFLPRTHGSALFERGQTQALTIATLGSPSMEMLIQDMYGERNKRFMHFYNFPPYSVGEVGRFMGPKPREIGHGMIAEKALKPVIPSQDEFPYTIILVSEIISSNGSSSMASTCGSTLALMDAGVPIKEMVGGIAMGLIVSDEDFTKYKILTDLSGEEDGAGYMDFKMTGTKDGVTAIQVDIKIKGIPMNVLPEIIDQSRAARIHVIEKMEETISNPKDTVSKYAPKMVTINIDPDKIGAVIGTGGKVIKKIQEETDTIISIEEDGKVVITSVNLENAEKARTIVEGLTKEIEVGEIYEGVVKEILGFGALVEVLPGKVGLLHVSEIKDGFVKNVEDFLKTGDSVKVKVVKTSPDGKFSLSKKALD